MIPANSVFDGFRLEYRAIALRARIALRFFEVKLMAKKSKSSAKTPAKTPAKSAKKTGKK